MSIPTPKPEVTIENYVKSQKINWLTANENGRKWAASVDQINSNVVFTLVQAVLARFPEFCPQDGYRWISQERQLVLGYLDGYNVSPSLDGYLFPARLKEAINQWKYAGSALGVLLQLHYQGVDGYIVQQSGLAYSLDTSIVNYSVYPQELIKLTCTVGGLLGTATFQITYGTTAYTVVTEAGYFKYQIPLTQTIIYFPQQLYKANAMWMIDKTGFFTYSNGATPGIEQITGPQNALNVVVLGANPLIDQTQSIVGDGYFNSGHPNVEITITINTGGVLGVMQFSYVIPGVGSFGPFATHAGGDNVLLQETQTRVMFYPGTYNAGETYILHTDGSVTHNVPVLPPVTRRVFSPVPTSGAIGPVGVNRVYSADWYVPSDVSSIVVRGANRAFNGGSGTSETIDIALYPSNGATPPLPVSSSFGDATFTLPGNGTFGASTSLGPVVRGGDGKVVMAYDFRDPVFVDATIQFGAYEDGTLVVDPPPAFSGGPNPNSNFWFSIQFSSRKDFYQVFGDSIANGYNVNFEQASWNLLSAQQDVGVCIEAMVFYGSYQNFSDPTTAPFLYDEITASGAHGISQLGTNDLNYNNLASMQTYAQAVWAHMRTAGCTDVSTWTVPPQAAYAGAEAVRLAFNQWLRDNYKTLGLRCIYDAAASQSNGGLASNSNASVLATAFDSGDGTHPNAAGQVQIKSGWLAALQAAPIAGGLVLQESVPFFTFDLNDQLWNRFMFYVDPIPSWWTNIQSPPTLDSVPSITTINIMKNIIDTWKAAVGIDMGIYAVISNTMVGFPVETIAERFARLGRPQTSEIYVF